MGWLIACNATGKSPKAEMNERLMKGNTRYRLIDSAMVGSVYYAAIQNIEKGYTVAIICLTSGGYDRPFGYKAMSECMGPSEAKCPERILNLLSPVEDIDNPSYAAAWRERCRAYHAARKAKGRPKKGQRVTFAEPITFTDGAKLATFTYDSGSRFIAEDGGRYRINGWKDRAYSVASRLT